MNAVASVGYTLSQQQFERLRRLVYETSGIALRPEKQQMVCARLSKRLRALGMSSFDEYYALASSDRGQVELEQLLNAITTNKTSFFREAHHFDELRKLIADRPRTAEEGAPRIRVWSAGCSTGEEAYTIAMTVLEALPAGTESGLRILASDLDSDVLAVAERGVYTAERMQDLPAPLLKRWFIPGTADKAGQYRAREALREKVAFRRINFVDPIWPIHTKFDAIFCRNALIYFDGPTQREIVGRLLGFLVPGGYLFLGHSESMAGTRPELKQLGRTTYRLLEEAR